MKYVYELETKNDRFRLSVETNDQERADEIMEKIISKEVYKYDLMGIIK